MDMVDLSNPYEAQRFADQQGIPVSALYNMDVQHKTQLIQKTPDNPRLYLERGNDYYELQDYDSAIKDYLKADELRPNNPQIYHYLGDCYYQKKETEKAIEYLTKTTEFSDYDKLDCVYEHRAIIYFEMQDYQKALPDINKAIEIKPEGFSEYYKYRSLILYGLKDFENANKDFEYYRTCRINAMKIVLENSSYRDKEDALVNLFASLNNNEQNQLLAELIIDHDPNL